MTDLQPPTDYSRLRSAMRPKVNAWTLSADLNLLDQRAVGAKLANAPTPAPSSAIPLNARPSRQPPKITANTDLASALLAQAIRMAATAIDWERPVLAIRAMDRVMGSTSNRPESPASAKRPLSPPENSLASSMMPESKTAKRNISGSSSGSV